MVVQYKKYSFLKENYQNIFTFVILGCVIMTQHDIRNINNQKNSKNMNFKFLSSGVSLILALFVMTFAASCGDDDPVIPVVEGINVADGFYMAKTGVDPTAAAGLVAETVEDDGFSSQTRSGFIANYVYLAAGDYNMVQIASKKISKTFGGTAQTITDTGSGCDYNDYQVVTLADGGAAFSVAAGLHKVTYDEMTGEMVLYKIETPGLIGSATEGGWGSDVAFTGSVDANGGSWSATEVILREGEFKLRFNCRWSLDRRIDSSLGFGADNGYQMFINYGGSLSNLLTGNDGANIPIAAADVAEYTVDVTWDGADGWKVALTKTGEAPIITFVPDDHEWALVGDATPGGWDTDTDMNYEGVSSGIYTWEAASIDLVPGGFKFRTNDSWDENIGWGQVTLTGDVSDFSDDNGNIKVTTAASYKVVLTTNDDGGTYTAAFTQL